MTLKNPQSNILDERVNQLINKIIFTKYFIDIIFDYIYLWGEIYIPTRTRYIFQRHNIQPHVNHLLEYYNLWGKFQDEIYNYNKNISILIYD